IEADQVEQDPRVAEFKAALDSSEEGRKKPPQKDRNLILNQYRRTYTLSEDGKTDVVASETSLLKEDIRRQPVPIINLAKEVRFVWDANNKELSIQKIYFDEKLNRNRVLEAHVF